MAAITVEYVDDVDASYASAFVEADGCIYLNSADISVRVTNRNRDVLRWFEFKFGGCERQKVNPEGCFEWVIYGEAALGFIDIIEPHMKFKSPQCAIAREFHSLKGRKGVKLTERIVQRRKQLLDDLKREKAKWRSN